MRVANPRGVTRAPAGASEPLGVLVFARSPVPGRCKSRLARGYGSRRAARLYSAMLERAVAGAARSTTRGKPTPVTLFAAPDPHHPCFPRLARRYGVDLVRQAQGDLGRGMHRAFQWGLARYDRIVLMGTDQPRLDHGWLKHAHDALEHECAAWLAPTHDGGFWALGLRRAPAALFHGQRWGAAQVARVTRQRMHRLGFAYTEFAARRDVDDRRDWQALPGRVRAPVARHASLPGLRAKSS